MKILVVDDHALIREALRGVLAECAGDATVLEAGSAREALARAAEHADLGLVLLDLTLPDADGLDVLGELRESRPEVSVVVLSASDDRATIVRALELGALGFIPKTAPREHMLRALELVFAGGVYVPPEILERTGASRATPRPAIHAPSAAALGLTERQLEVLERMMRGASNKAICRELGIAEPTVKNHVTAILRALDASNRTEAVIAAAARLRGPGHRAD